MKLAEWRRKEHMTQAALAAELCCSQSYISQIERAVDALVPGPALMVLIYQITGGAVQPNDFYSLPMLSPAQKAA